MSGDMKFKEFLNKFRICRKVSSSGQALIALIFISAIGIVIASGAVILIYINSSSGLKVQEGNRAYQIAQSGAENALLRLLRNPAYTGETGLAIGDGFVDVTVTNTGGTYYIATASGTIGDFVRKIQINAHYNESYELVIDSRKEIF